MVGIVEAVCAAMLLAGAPAPAKPAQTEADRIIREIEAIQFPSVDPAKRGDKEYQKSYAKTRQQLIRKRNDLILELYKAAPGYQRIGALLLSRWNSIVPDGAAGEALFEEIDQVLAATRDAKLKIDGAYVKAQARLYQGMKSGKPDLTLVDEFIKLAPKDERAPRLLYMAYGIVKDEKTKIALESRLLREYTDTQYAAAVDGGRRQRLGLGKPFHLEFNDAIWGYKVSVKDLKGKVVVVDFWASWCGPCIAEMPTLKKLYAKYRDRGVEFIGVSLDEPKDKGGLDKLKACVAKNEIPWPQYYQGKGWKSDFSKSWGVHTIPTLFVIDAGGNLMSVTGLANLEKLLGELVKKPVVAKGGGSGKG